MKNRDFFRLSDANLAFELGALQEELRRRQVLVDRNIDPWQAVQGCEAAKRALIVAMAGDFHILFVGAPGVGKTMLRAAGAAMGFYRTFEAWPCLCGYSNVLYGTCNCTVRQIIKHRLEWRSTAITIEVCRRNSREMQVDWVGRSMLDIQKELYALVAFTDVSLSEPCKELLRYFTQEESLDARQRDVTVRIARAIANLDQSEQIRPTDISEAINYRFPTIREPDIERQKERKRTAAKPGA